MVRLIDAVFTKGAFQPLEPLKMPEGTRVQLSIVEGRPDSGQAPPTAKIHTPRLANKKDAAKFVMEVRETGNAGV